MHMARQDNEYTRAMFDYSFTAALAVTLKADQLVCDMRVVNTDSKEFDFTAALHTYFAANVGDVRVEGLGQQGRTLLGRSLQRHHVTG